MTITAGGPVIVFHKEIMPAAPRPPARRQQLLVSQTFFRNGDRYRMEGNEKFDKYVTTEFLTGAVYGANIVVTNPDERARRPRSAAANPAGRAARARQHARRTAGTCCWSLTRRKTFEYYFYFPASRGRRTEVPALSR